MEKEASELVNSPGSTESESCAGFQLPAFHCGGLFFCHESQDRWRESAAVCQYKRVLLTSAGKRFFQNGNLSHSEKFPFMNFPSEWIFRAVLQSRDKTFSKTSKRVYFSAKDVFSIVSERRRRGLAMLSRSLRPSRGLPAGPRGSQL
ncbi:uncharacterized protein FYN16_005051 [Cariama cristata]